MNDKMKAGRDLDALISTKVMNLPLPATGANLSYPYHYSTDLHAAWMIVEKLREDGLGFIFGSRLTGEWFAEFGPCGPVISSLRRYANTAPLAISLAALAAVKEKG